MTPLELVRAALADPDERVAVTGATGWFGATAMELLHDALGDEASGRVTGYASAARDLVLSDGRSVPVRPIAELASAAPAPTVLLHFAYLTRDRVADLGVETYVARNVGLSAQVLEAVRRHRPRAVVAASSGAVYAPGGGYVHDVAADPYGALKRVDELAFLAAAAEVGGTCVVPRIFSVGGPFITKPEAYALGSMIMMALAGEPVRVTARRPVVRTYCGVDEVVALSLWAALRGPSRVLDSAGDPVEVGELAAAVARVLGGGPVVRPELDPTLPPDRYCASGADMAALAREAGLELRGLDDIIRTTAGSLAVRRDR